MSDEDKHKKGEKMITGCCRCQSVKFRITGEIKKVINCHCDLCRKMNGAAFSTYAAVLQADFELLAGELSSYNVSKNVRKHFCGKCGTPIYNTNSKYADLNIMHLGSLDSISEIRPDVNIYNKLRVTWLSDISKLPTFALGME